MHTKRNIVVITPINRNAFLQSCMYDAERRRLQSTTFFLWTSDQMINVVWCFGGHLKSALTEKCPSVTSQRQKNLACLFWHVVTSLTSTMFWHLVTSLKSTTLIVAWRRARRCNWCFMRPRPESAYQGFLSFRHITTTKNPCVLVLTRCHMLACA